MTRVGGRTDLDLVESGLAQGVALGQHLKDQGLIPDVIFTTAMKRTQQTAQQAKTILGKDIPTEIMEIFNEIDYGVDENKAEEEVVARLGIEAIRAWDEHAVVPDGWLVDPEGLRTAWREFGQNVLSNFSGKTVLIVTHNGIARFASALLQNADDLGNADDNQKNLKLGTGSYGHFVHDENAWHCAKWNIKPSV